MFSIPNESRVTQCLSFNHSKTTKGSRYIYVYNLLNPSPKFPLFLCPSQSSLFSTETPSAIYDTLSRSLISMRPVDLQAHADAPTYSRI
ncbi:hypothetical protein DID88_005730 [Monilinia fructigena]|uniref:Uncharacterized protein n=1 Tax=Monilinia fructigena TaxID=38457 RepID=A0A395J0N4_9HELO|nr:hypothetical protein DID88_005730 [Monilinia fructigena]